ncbi:MAG: hypothetical protein ACRDCW_02365 [Sarcina sp.]
MEREEKFAEIFKQSVRKQDEYRNDVISTICSIALFLMMCAGYGGWRL